MNYQNSLSIENFLTLIFEISYEYFSKTQFLNDNLQEINEKLDNVSYTISHDLGTPLAVMKLNIQLLAKKLQKHIICINTNKLYLFTYNFINLYNNHCKSI